MGLTWGASLCFPQAMPAKRAKVSLPKEMASGNHTITVPWSPIRSRSRQESISGKTSPPKMPAVRWAKGTAPSFP